LSVTAYFQGDMAKLYEPYKLIYSKDIRKLFTESLCLHHLSMVNYTAPASVLI